MIQVVKLWSMNCKRFCILTISSTYSYRQNARKYTFASIAHLYGMLMRMCCWETYRRPHVLFGSLILFSGTFPPPNHFLVAVNSDRLRPFLESSCGQKSRSFFSVLRGCCGVSVTGPQGLITVV